MSFKTKQLNFDSPEEYIAFLKTLKTMPKQYNRDVVGSHAIRMMSSVKELQIQRGVVVIYTNLFGEGYQYYIADGQHLVNALINIPIKFVKGMLSVVINYMDDIDEVINFVSKMNSTAKKWGLANYLDAWYTCGYGDYALIREINLTDGFGISALVEAYSGKVASGNVDFKNGTFKANRKLGDKIIKLYRMAVKLGLRSSRSSFSAVIRFYFATPKFDEAYFLLGLRNGKHFGKKFQRDGYITLFNIYCSPKIK